MVTHELRMRCQRCGEQMDMKDPEPGGAWKPDQFWVCAKCGRHFWTTYAKPPAPADAPPTTPQGPGTADPGPSR